MTTPDSVQCLCGKVMIHRHGQPAARANCHCPSCQDFYGTSVFSATAWQAGQVKIERSTVSTFPHPTKQLTRAFCNHCGEIVFGTNRLGMTVLPNSILARVAGSQLPEALRPTMHLFYRHRTIDIQDELPKYLDGWNGPTYDSSSDS